MTLDQLYAAAQQHVLSRNNPTSPVDVANILLNYIAENGGSVDGTAINPSSIGATTPGTVATTSLRIGSSYRFESDGSQIYAYNPNNGNYYISIVGGQGGISSASFVPLAWTNGQSYGTADLLLWRDDAAGVLAQRNGTNAQESRLYGTYTSSTVYERLSSKYDSGSGAFVIGTEKGASGGSARNLEIRINGSLSMTFSTSGVTATTVSSSYLVLGTTSYLQSTGSGRILLDSNSVPGTFDRLQFGGTTSSYPALKRNGTGIDFRLADDSADAPITVSTVKTVPVLYSDLPDAAKIGDGARAFITDGASAYPANIGGTASGVGANPTPVMTLGGAWIYG